MHFSSISWDLACETLQERGFVVLKKGFDAYECQRLIELYEEPQHFRKTIVMERYRFGQGEYKYFSYPLPDPIQTARTALYEAICPVANQWMKALNTGVQFPPAHADFLKECRDNRQLLATPLLLKYGRGGHNTLHQDLYGAVYFPLQAVVFLNESGVDYTGGEFVLTEQVPRAQSKATVLTPEQGDVLVFATRFRPQKGQKGYYRVTMKHGVSEVHTGNRHTLGLIFHDAQ